MRWAAPLTLVAAVGQALMEGPRWQLVPAYALALALCVASAVRGVRVPRPVRFVATAVGLVVLLIAVALPVAVPVWSFREPSGPDAIGTVTYAWMDTSRPELFTPDPDDHRELVAQVWYPDDHRELVAQVWYPADHRELVAQVWYPAVDDP